MNQKKSILLILLVGLFTIVSWQFPLGRLILYPFTILGTWFHEMGHGLVSILLGGSFIRLEIFPDGSGLAVHTSNSFLGGFGRALIAAAGPVGPTIAGSVLIISSKYQKITGYLMFLFAALQVISCIFWIRSVFGFVIIILFAITIFVISMKGSDNFRMFTLQFLGIQAFSSLYLSFGYLFSTGGQVSVNTFASDTSVISQSLFFPYWFWAGLIIAFSTVLIAFSFWVLLRNKASQRMN